MLEISDLTTNTYYNTLSYLMLLKYKRTTKVKTRECTNGRPQHKFISKGQSSSPIVSIYALMISSTLNAIVEMKVVTCNVMGAFFQEDRINNINCYLKFGGVTVNMICDIGPEYKKYLFSNKKTRKKKLYRKLTNSVYSLDPY